MLTEEERKEINKLKEIWGECQGYGKVHLKRRYDAICKLEEYEKEYWHLKNKYNLLEKDNIALIRHNKKQQKTIDKAIAIYEECGKKQNFSTCDLEMYESLKGL